MKDVLFRSLLTSHNLRRIDTRRAKRRQPARGETDGTHHECDSDERKRVVRRNAEQQAPHESRSEKRADNTDTESDHQQCAAFLQDHALHAPLSAPRLMRMPISFVRALTENASTPAIPTAAMITASIAERRHERRVQPARRDALIADLRHRQHVLDRILRRDAAHDARRRRR